MKNQNFAAFAAAALVLGGLFTATPASAGNWQVEVYPSGRHGDWHDGRRGHGGRDERHGRRGTCEPHEAIAKAHEWGLRRPGIVRVTPYEIVVAGRHRGDRAVLVFDRGSRRCRVIDARGI